MLLLLDYFEGRKISRKSIFEKAFLLIPCVFFGMATVIFREEAGHISEFVSYSVMDKFFYSTYAMSFYLVKFVIPTGLSAYYVMPKELPLIYYLSPIVLIIITMFIIKFRALKKEYVLGFGIFLIPISIVAFKIIPYGNAIVADRYSYLSIIGLSYVIASTYSYFIQKKSGLKVIPKAVLVFFTMCLSVLSWSKIPAWENSISLWSDATKNSPDAYLAFSNLGKALNDDKRYQEAEKELTKAIQLNQNYSTAYANRGNSYYNLKNYTAAYQDYSLASKLNPDDFLFLNNKGLAAFSLNKYDEAIIDFTKSIELNPKYSEAYNNRGMVRDNQLKYEMALADFSKAIELNSAYAIAYNNRGIVKFKLKNYAEAIPDFDRAIQLKQDFALPYLNRGSCKHFLNRQVEACTDWKIALNLGYNQATPLLETYCK
jgi:tetratricopeptide (TPR) repeat protein